MNIILDGFGGDNAPLEALRGAAAAVRAYDVAVIVTGDAQKLADCAASNRISLDKIRFVHAPQVIPMDADPTQVLKAYSDSSLAVGLRLLADGEGDAFVSAGSTGALLVGATFLVKRIKGVRRPGIATMIPCGGGKSYLLLDAGANHDCRAEMLTQFAVMGAAYYEKVVGIARPRVGLINIGTEPHKGDELRREAFSQLSAAPGLHFIGNIEARALPTGGCDVAVCDGFTGNVILKLTEGFGSFFTRSLKEMLFANLGTKLAAVLLRGQLTSFKNSLDYKEHGGAPLLGIRKPVIKAHGSSNAVA
ncbi:MAG: phosphate acyltransferase PlsX, partial [Oscillospiraceae bacterium]